MNRLKLERKPLIRKVFEKITTAGNDYTNLVPKSRCFYLKFQENKQVLKLII